MKKRELITFICLGVLLSTFVPTEILATKTNEYGAQQITAIGDKLQSFMFDVVVPYTGGIFGGIHTVKSLVNNNYQAMGGFALLAASSFILPHFLKGVFGNSLLLLNCSF